MNTASLYRYFKKSSGVCTDTRRIRKNCLFIALKGENFNGNQFVEEAFANGASYALVDEKSGVINDSCFLVEDALGSLQELAVYHRKKFTIPVLALTGSNGKTTTKELIVSVLKKKYKVHYTSGNLNNHIGLPITLLNLNESHDISIIEMGANHKGEIKRLCEIGTPDYGLITNIGDAHLEGFGGYEGVIKGKTELYDYIRKQGRLLFVNEEDDLLLEKSRDIPRMLYGPVKNNIRLANETPFLHLELENQLIKTRLTGIYNLQNVHAAFAIGVYFRVDKKDILQALSEYSPDNNRSQVVEFKSNTLILDAYNANPTSVKAALKNLAAYNSNHSKKIVALGDMLELGSDSERLHSGIVALLKAANFDEVILVGPEFIKAAKDSSFLTFEDSAAAAEYFSEYKPDDFLMLIKGSRGMRMEKILKNIAPGH